MLDELKSTEGNPFRVPDSTPLEVEPSEALSVRIPVGTARAFAKRTLEVVGAGRPSCPLCGYPMDPEGHVCP